MLSEDATARERAELTQRMRATLAQILRDLKHLPEAVRKARSKMPPPQDPVSLDRLLDSRERALNHARRAAAGLGAAGTDGADLHHALADVHELVEEVRTGLASRSILDDVDEMMAEATARPDQRALGALDSRTRRIGAEADRLFALVLTAQQDISAGARPMTPPPETSSDEIENTAAAVRELSEVIAATLAGSGAAAPPPARSADRRFAAVADQISASLRAYGLPHDGAQLPRLDAAAAVRGQLIEGLRRNFTSRDADGTRVYVRSAPQPIAQDATRDTRLLRGAALVNANLLREEANGVLAIVERLPDMLRFVPARSSDLTDARARLRGLIGGLVEAASDPLGINPQRGRFQFKRLSAAVIEVLRSGEVIGGAAQDSLADDAAATGRVWANLARGEGEIPDDLRTRTSAVRAEEVIAELRELSKLMVAIRERLGTPAAGTGRGIAASRLEELLTAADGAAAALEGELERFGTTPVEQEVQFLGGEGQGISLAQFLGWTRAVCAPFVGTDNTAAALLREELGIVSEELKELNARAADFGRRAGPVRFGGVRRQFDELRQFLSDAAHQAEILVSR